MNENAGMYHDGVPPAASANTSRRRPSEISVRSIGSGMWRPRVIK
jgi:hypothetical protein